ncbi:MAG TPA: DUF1801 domain-containing protein [Nocardioides sp.]|nr:DUF1801 domain-containing protein [Nocardioides sp.]
MHSDAPTVEDYLAALPAGRREALTAIRDTVNANLDDGFAEGMEYGMVTWGVPLERYPTTYNGKPLGVVSLASQKNHMALYLMCLYADDGLEEWFRQQYAARGMKLDLGKSCVRFRSLDEVPLDVLAALLRRVTPEQHIARYEESRAATRKGR